MKQCAGNYFSFSVQVFDVALCTWSLSCLLSPFLILPVPFLCGRCCSSAADALRFQQSALLTFPEMASPAAVLRIVLLWLAASTHGLKQPLGQQMYTSFLWVRTCFTALNTGRRWEWQSGAVMWLLFSTCSWAVAHSCCCSSWFQLAKRADQVTTDYCFWG